MSDNSGGKRRQGDNVGPCTFTYKDGHRCDGRLSIVAYATGNHRRTEHRYVILSCSKKTNHAMERPAQQGAHCGSFGLEREALIERFDLEYWDAENCVDDWCRCRR